MLMQASVCVRGCVSLSVCVLVCLCACARWEETNTCAYVSCFPCSPAVVVVRGAGSSPPAASPEEQAERTAGKSPHAAQHEQHEAWPHTQVRGGSLPHLLSLESRLYFAHCKSMCSVQFKVAYSSKMKPFLGVIMPHQQKGVKWGGSGVMCSCK